MKPFRIVVAGHVQTENGSRPVALKHPQRGILVYGEDADDAVERFETVLSRLVADDAEQPSAADVIGEAG